MSIINIKDIKKIQKQAKKHKMEVIFYENKEVITMINKYIESSAKNDKNDFVYELKENSNINELKEYYRLAGFYVVEYNEFGNHELVIQW